VVGDSFSGSDAGSSLEDFVVADSVVEYDEDESGDESGADKAQVQTSAFRGQKRRKLVVLSQSSGTELDVASGRKGSTAKSDGVDGRGWQEELKALRREVRALVEAVERDRRGAGARRSVCCCCGQQKLA
jgi:hypothetical protein